MQVMARSLYQWMINSPKYKDKLYKKAKLKVRMIIRGCIVILSSKKYDSEPIVCDVLLIHPSYKSYKQGRKKKLVNMLQEKGLIVEEFIEKKDRDKILGREFCKIKKAPLLFKWEAYHANYILIKYQAKVILTERNGWVLPSFIKKIRRSESLVVHMAHSIPNMQSSKYNYYDYDFYLLYGKSSYDYLSKLDYFFGNCKILFRGPYFFYNDRKYVKTSSIGKNITFLCSGPDYENSLLYIEACCWVEKLVEENVVDKLYIKCHPRGDNERWLKFYNKFPCNVELINDESLYDSLDNSKYAVMNYTNAIIDMAYYGIPIIMLGESPDYFSLKKYSVPWVKSYSDLVSIIDVGGGAPQLEFARYHVEHIYDASSSLVESIKSIVNNEDEHFSASNIKLLGGDSDIET